MGGRAGESANTIHNQQQRLRQRQRHSYKKRNRRMKRDKHAPEVALTHALGHRALESSFAEFCKGAFFDNVICNLIEPGLSMILFLSICKCFDLEKAFYQQNEGFTCTRAFHKIFTTN